MSSRALWVRWSWRDLRARWAQVCALALVIALGTGTYAALLSTSAWRTQFNDASFALLHTHDLRVALAAGSTVPQGSLLADKQFVQGYIADSYAQLMQFRLFVLYTAWTIDKHNDYRKVRKDIATVKVVMPDVLHDIAWRAMQVHGALGVSNEMPFMRMVMGAAVMGLADGPTEVHKVTLARLLLKEYAPAPDQFPSEHFLRLKAEAEAKVADRLQGVPRK